MFANLGVQSEHRDANKHPTGRRHAPREMTSETGVPNFGTQEANEGRCASAQAHEEMVRRANVGPSFMDRIFDKENKRTALPHGTGVNRPAGAPKDHLNVFSWHIHGTEGGNGASPAPGWQATGAGVAAPASSQPAVADAEMLRYAEARKFEANTKGHFLAFSEDKKSQPVKHTGKKTNNGVVRQREVQAPFATEEVTPSSNNGNIGSTAQHRRGKKVAPAAGPGDGNEVQGFKGMGGQCNTKHTGRKVGKVEPSQVFLPFHKDETAAEQSAPKPKYVPQRPPWLQCDDEAERLPSQPPPPLPPQERSQKSVRFQDDRVACEDRSIYEDEQYYTDANGDAGLFHEQQMLQEESQRRVPQFQRCGRERAGSDEGASGGY